MIIILVKMQLGSDDLFLFSEDRLSCQFYDKAAS